MYTYVAYIYFGIILLLGFVLLYTHFTTQKLKKSTSDKAMALLEIARTKFKKGVIVVGSNGKEYDSTGVMFGRYEENGNIFIFCWVDEFKALIPVYDTIDNKWCQHYWPVNVINNAAKKYNGKKQQY